MRSDKAEDQPQSELVFEAEKILLRSVLGGKEYVDDDLGLISAGEKPKVEPTKLDVRLIFGDITAIETPIVIVGQYRNLPPGGAGRAVDTKIGGLISRGFEYNMPGMELGEIFTLPLSKLPFKEINEAVEAVMPKRFSIAESKTISARAGRSATNTPLISPRLFTKKRFRKEKISARASAKRG